jgi:hypothetical protein
VQSGCQGWSHLKVLLFAPSEPTHTALLFCVAYCLFFCVWIKAYIYYTPGRKETTYIPALPCPLRFWKRTWVQVSKSSRPDHLRYHAHQLSLLVWGGVHEVWRVMHYVYIQIYITNIKSFLWAHFTH